MSTHSRPITTCQISGSTNLIPILFLGYVPPVNSMRSLDERPAEELMFPLELLYCPESHLAQIGCEVDPAILFPPDYPYTSGTTRILRENFADLFRQTTDLLGISEDSFVIDIGSNDGTLLGNFHEGGCRVLGIEPTDRADLAIARGIESIKRFFGLKTAKDVRQSHGQADLITAANVFAHIPDVHDVVDGIVHLLSDDGVFISENHYLLGLLETLQYDTVYHEHLRYYSVAALRNLFEPHDLEIFRVERIPTHGGSIRVYTCRKGQRTIDSSVADILQLEEAHGLMKTETYQQFATDVMASKLDLMALIRDLKSQGKRIVGIGSPSRASTLISYTGLDHHMMDAIMEIKGSHKIGKYMPGTRIPVLDEELLYREQPEYALLLSWHIAKELMHNLKRFGYKGDFIIPLPTPRIILNEDADDQ